MTVNQSLSIREVFVENKNQSSIKLVSPKNIVPKPFTEVHFEGLGSIIERVSDVFAFFLITAN